jgi:hypothetical protein
VFWTAAMLAGLTFELPILVSGLLSAPFVLAARRIFGRSWLRRALRDREDHRLQLTDSPFIHPVERREAIGALALRALERGDLDAMVRHARRAARLEVASTPGLGAITPAIVAWLVPDRMPPKSVWRSAAYAIDASREHPLLPALRLLEATSSTDDAAVLGAWQAVSSSEPLRTRPRLFLLLQAVASERIPAVEAQLDRTLDADESETLREFLARFFPRFSEPRPTGYRVDADEHRALALPSSSDEVRAVVRAGRERLSGRSRSVRGLRRALWATAGAGFAGLALGAPLGLGLVSLAMLGGIARRAGEDRMLSLGGSLKIPASRTWRREFDTTPAGQPIARNARECEIFVSCVWAEQALEAGRPAQAWDHVQWWLAGFDPGYTRWAELRPIAGSLARIAIFSGHYAAARSVLDHAKETPRVQTRTLQGDGRESIVLARALLAARQGDWRTSAKWLSAGRYAEAWFTTEVTPLQRALFRSLARRARAEGHTVRGWRRTARPGIALDTVQVLWPELLDESG